MVTHGRDSTVWSIRRFFDAGWVRDRPYLHCNSGPETATQEKPMRRGGRKDPFCQRRSKRRERIITVFVRSCPGVCCIPSRTVYTERTCSHPQRGVLPNMAKRQDAPPASVPQAGPALRQKTYSRTGAFEMSGNSHARLLYNCDGKFVQQFNRRLRIHIHTFR